MYDYKKIHFINYRYSLILFIKQKQCIFQNFELLGCFAIKVKRKKPFLTLIRLKHILLQRDTL